MRVRVFVQVRDIGAQLAGSLSPTQALNMFHQIEIRLKLLAVDSAYAKRTLVAVQALIADATKYADKANLLPSALRDFILKEYDTRIGVDSKYNKAIGESAVAAADRLAPFFTCHRAVFDE
jgi:hypothetical protein